MDPNSCSLIISELSKTLSVSGQSTDDITKWVSSIGVLVGAVSAIVTLIFITFEKKRTDQNNEFREIFQHFWDDEKVELARHIIDYEQEYKKALNAITKATKPSENENFSDKEIACIEAIDKFCAIIARLNFYGLLPLYGKQKALSDKMFVNHWVAKIESRTELKEYIQKFWPDFFNASANTNKNKK